MYLAPMPNCLIFISTGYHRVHIFDVTQEIRKVSMIHDAPSGRASMPVLDVKYRARGGQFRSPSCPFFPLEFDRTPWTGSQSSTMETPSTPRKGMPLVFPMGLAPVRKSRLPTTTSPTSYHSGLAWDARRSPSRKEVLRTSTINSTKLCVPAICI